ncbi:hypothetical protein KJ605_00280 [Patescibacteria group bacterium]|nr:hypothetical protein [Patescibacteria group bacterium]MBU1970205.1 hypothetical protein [Patescibacteria group bacterium]
MAERAETDQIVTIIPGGGGIDAHGGERTAQLPAFSRSESTDQAREEPKPGVYYEQRTRAILEDFADRLPNPEQKARYQEVLTKLAEHLTLDEGTAEAYGEVWDDLAERGGKAVASKTKEHFQSQLSKALIMVDGYAQVESAAQERAVLVYAEALLANLQKQSIYPDEELEGRAFDANEALEGLGLPPEESEPLVAALNGLTNFADFSFIQCGLKLTERTDAYLSPDDPAARVNNVVQLNPVEVERHLQAAHSQIEGAYRRVIEALDELGPPEAAALELANREQNPELDLQVNPFADWEEEVANRYGITLSPGEHLPNRCYVSAVFGRGRDERGFMGFAREHKIKHLVENVEHRAEVVDGGQVRLEKVLATRITLKAAITSGEWREGQTLRPGESRPPEFFKNVFDVQVWGVEIDSANKAANLLDQLNAAEGVELEGNEVVEVITRDDPRLAEVEAYRIPVKNHRNESEFLVVDRQTYEGMRQAAEVSRDSYARLAALDPRYAESPPEERHAHFRAQLYQHENTPEGWVERQRDFIVTERISRERTEALRATGNEVDEFVAEQLEQALESYRRQFNEFQLNFGHPARYREVAVARLASRNVGPRTPDYKNLVLREMDAVAWEYLDRWTAFRAVTSRVLSLRETAQEAVYIDRQFIKFLANLDYKLEFQIRQASIELPEVPEGIDARWFREAPLPFSRSTEPPTFRGRLLNTVFSEAQIAYRTVKPKSGERWIKRVPTTIEDLLTSHSPLVQMATDFACEQAIEEPQSLESGLKAEAYRVVEALKALNAGEDQSPLAVFKRNLAVLTETYEMDYPTGESVRSLIGEQRVDLERWLNRELNPYELNRLVEGRWEVTQEREQAIKQLMIVRYYYEIARDMNKVLSGVAKRRAKLDKFTPEELIIYAGLIAATVKATAAVDLTQIANLEEIHPHQPLLETVAIHYENALNELLETSSLGSELRERLSDIRI